MGGARLQISNGKENGLSSNFNLGLQWGLSEEGFHQPPGGLFASVGQMGNVGFGGVSPNLPNP